MLPTPLTAATMKSSHDGPQNPWKESNKKSVVAIGTWCLYRPLSFMSFMLRWIKGCGLHKQQRREKRYSQVRIAKPNCLVGLRQRSE